MGFAVRKIPAGNSEQGLKESDNQKRGEKKLKTGFEAI
jgi:hypothetical protein